jgi:HK97 family phage major capsid protein
MKKSDQLKQTRSVKQDAQQAIVDKTRSENNREMTADEEKQFDELQGEIDGLNRSIERELNVEKMELDRAARNANPVITDKGDGEEAEKRGMKKRYSLLKHMRTAGEGKALDGVEKEMDDLGKEENRAAGVTEERGTNIRVPMFVIRADGQTVTQDGGLYGGALVHNQAPRVQESFHPRLFLETLGATRLSGLTGGSIPLPTFGTYSYEWLSETGAITPQKTQISGPVLSPERLGAAVPISERLLLQSSIDAEMWVLKELRVGYENALQYAAINGTGTNNQPRGLLNTTGVQSVTHPARVPSRADILALQSLLEITNVGSANLGFLTHPAMKFALKGAAVTAQAPIFLWQGEEVDGVKAVSSSLVPNLAGNYPLIYGDWGNLYIGEWGAMNLKIDPYTRVLTNEIQVVINAHAGIAVGKPSAFAVDKFLTTA